MPGDHSLPAVSTAEGIIQLIRNWIETAALKEGDRLPTERALAEQFNLNRNLVRRAFHELDRMGLIHRHVGRGTFVGTSKKPLPERPARLHPASTIAAPREADFSPATILQTRSMIEPQIAVLAVASARQIDVKALNDIIERIGQAATQRDIAMIDIEFQQALAEATHNDLVVELAKLIAAARVPASRAPGAAAGIAEDERAAIAADYQAIVEALARRDPTAAANAVRAALLRATRAFSMLARMELLPEIE